MKRLHDPATAPARPGLRSVLTSVSLAALLYGALAAPADLSEAEAAHARRDYATALRLLKVEAERGDIDAQFKLALMHGNGQGVPRDQTQAAKWFHKATDKLDPGAQFNVALMYFQGQGLPKDPEQAAYWFRKAALRGDSEAQFNLGLLYDGGHGLAADPMQAVRWYRMAAEQGLKVAQINLAAMYRDGQGVRRDHRQAYVWYALAAGQDDEGATKERDRIAKLLTPAQYREAVRLLHEQELKGFEPAAERPPG
jgi:TPR repeat protein